MAKKTTKKRSTAPRRSKVQTAKRAKAPAGAKRTKAAPPAQGEKPKKKLSALDAAAQVLREAGTAMSTGELIEAMASKGLWTSPGGKTPAATLYAAIGREIATKGDAARFVKTVERGKFLAAA